MTAASVGVKPRIEASSSKRLVIPPEKQVFLLSAVLIVATVALYYTVGTHPFVNHDDDIYVYQNAHVQAGLSRQTFKWAFTTFDAANWHPLTWLSHAMDYQLFGLNPGGHHNTNLLLHVANALLLFWVLLNATGYRGRSFMVAALFALHPINVESVVWVAERKNLLSMLFFLLALGAYRWYAREPRAGRYTTVALLFLFGLMAKPQVITLPCVLLLWDYWPLRRMFASGPGASSGTSVSDLIPARKFSDLLLEKLPFLGLAGVAAAITMQAQRSGHAMSQYPLALRLENAVVAYARYVGKAFWPADLSLMYPHPLSIPLWQTSVALLLLFVVSTGVLERWRSRYLTVGWMWFLGTLVPMIGLVQVGVQAMADRYAYLPFIGLFIMVCWGVAEWARQRHVAAIQLAGASFVVLLALAVVSYRQITYWEDNIVLWTHAVQVTKDNWTAEDNLGGAYLELGELEKAVPHFYRARAIYPRDATASLNIGFYEQHHGLTAQAIEDYQRVLMVNPSTKLRADALMNMGYAYDDLGDCVNARDRLKEAATLLPDNGEVWTYLGVAAQRCGDVSLAVEAYSRGMKLRPQDWGYVLLAQALELSGRPQEAQAAMEQARRMSKNFEQARKNAARILSR